MVHCEVVLELVVLGPVNTTTKNRRQVGCPDETMHWHATCQQNLKDSEAREVNKQIEII
jgi:hypothetical protein